jgi:hypothetical protein
MQWSITADGLFTNYGVRHVFKKCISMENNHEHLVMLEKPKDGFLCNESRNQISDRNMAKFRCNGLMVRAIFNIIAEIQVFSIQHKNENTSIIIDYKVGQFVEPDWFDPNLDNVCAPGIHYFLTPEAAKSYQFSCGHCIIGNRIYDDDGNHIDCYENRTIPDIMIFSPTFGYVVSISQPKQNNNGIRICKPSRKLKQQPSPPKIYKCKQQRNIQQPLMRKVQLRYRGCIRS